MQTDLLERYPDIAFHLTYLPFEPFEQDGKRLSDGKVLHSPNIDEEMAEFVRGCDLEHTDILVVYGLGLGYHYLYLKEWLHQRPYRALVFVEHDGGVIDACSKMTHAEALFKDPQVHLYAIFNLREWKKTIEEIAAEFASDRIVCLASRCYAKLYASRFRRMRFALIRHAVSVHALFSEALYAHKLVKNLIPNFKRLPQAFYANKLRGAFKQTPAIICGAGPSLSQAIPILKELENRALIFAGGSSISALSSQGIIPHFNMALDPNPDEYLRLKPATAHEVPLLYGNRLLPDVFALYNGPHGYIRSDTGGLCETWIERRCGMVDEAIGPDLGQEAFSVTTLAISMAREMGCSPIILVGVDLAYTGMRRYAEGVMEDASACLSKIRADKRAAERVLKRKDRLGNRVYTLVKWVMESESIAAYAKRYPEVVFLNATSGGIGFRTIAYQPLEEIAERYCQTEYDLRGLIYAETQANCLSHLSSSFITEALVEVKESLLRLELLCHEMCSELQRVMLNSSLPCQTGKMAVLAADFEEECAFDALLQTLGPTLDRLMARSYPIAHHANAQQQREIHLKKELAKWEHFKTAIENYLEVIS